MSRGAPLRLRSLTAKHSDSDRNGFRAWFFFVSLFALFINCATRPHSSAQPPDVAQSGVSSSSSLVKRGFSSTQIARIHAIQPYVFQAARKHRLEPELIMGVIWVESRFQIRAKSPAGARGLMQLMPKTAAELAKQMGESRARSYDPRFNVVAGSFYLSKLINWFDGDLHLALAAYHAGPGNVKKWTAKGKHLLPNMSHLYIRAVLTARSRFRNTPSVPAKASKPLLVHRAVQLASSPSTAYHHRPAQASSVEDPFPPTREDTVFIAHPELDSGTTSSMPWASPKAIQQKPKKNRTRSPPEQSHQKTTTIKDFNDRLAIVRNSVEGAE